MAIGRAIEHDDVAREDAMRILDLIAVHPPDVGPAPGLLQEFVGDAPKRVTFLYRVLAWSVVLKLDLLRANESRSE